MELQMARLSQNLISKLEKTLCQLDATGVDYVFIRFDAKTSEVQVRANKLGQDFVKFSKVFKKFLEFCVSGTKHVQSINNGSGDCSSEDDAATLDTDGEFRFPGTQVVKAEVAPVDVKNEVDDTTEVPLKENNLKHPNDDQIGNKKRRGRPKGSKNKQRLKIEEVEEDDPKVDIISTLDNLKQEDCFVDRKEDMCEKERKPKRRSERNAINGIISELNQLNSIMTSEFEIENNNMKKSDESSLKVDEELGVEESTMDSKSAEFEKPMLMKNESRLKAEELKSKHLYACSECPKSFRTSLHLRVHYFLHFPSTRNFWCFSCTVCDKRFRGNYCWKNVHFRLHTDESFKLFLCPKCYRSFETGEGLRRHVVTHAKCRRYEHFIKPKKWLKCDVCPRSFQSKSHLERHLAAHRNTKASAFHVCHVCGHRSRDSSQMKRHMGSHMEKTLPCPTCSKMFPTMRDVTRHVQRIHAKAKSSCCDLCGKTFGCITHLRRHMLTMHFGAKPFECTECGKQFTSNWYLKKHSKEMHGATFQFQCPHCRFDFNTAGQLQQHGDTCRNKPFQEEDLTCNRCGKIFERRGHLREHQKREHRVHLPVISHRNPDLLPPRNQLTQGTIIDSDFKQVSKTKLFFHTS